MFQLIVFFMLASVVVEANLSDGQQLRGDLLKLSTDQITMDTGGQVRTLSRQELKDLVFSAEGEARPEPIAVVQLVDDSVIPCDRVELTQGQLLVRSASGSWKAPATAVRAIRWLRSGEKIDEEWNEILGKAASEDLLVLRRDANLDYLKGVITGVNEQAVLFEFSGNTIPVPFTTAAGIILARGSGELPNPRIRLATRDGGQWMLESAKLEGNQLSLVSVAGVKSSIPQDRVTRVEFPQLDAVFLSDLEPATVKFVPYFGSNEIGDVLEQFAAPQMDHSFDGQPLRLNDSGSLTGSRPFRRGLAAQSRTELVYRLAAKYRRFRATVGIDPLAASQANVKLVFWTDDEVVFSRTIAKEDEPMNVDIDVSGARRLRVVVDYGDNLDVGDRIHLGDARLTK